MAATRHRSRETDMTGYSRPQDLRIQDFADPELHRLDRT
jgi:hypothetical protein